MKMTLLCVYGTHRLEYNDANLSALHFKVDHGTVSTAVRKDIPAKTPFVRIPGALAVSSISALSHSLMGDALKTAYEEHPPSESSRGLVKLVANMHYVRCRKAATYCI